jgi:glutamine synthetase
MSNSNQILEYVWIDLNGNLRSKIKVNLKRIEHLQDFPIWNFDGSSTGQASSGNVSDVIIRPVRSYKNPFITNDSNSKIVLCECLNTDLTPHATNSRDKCERTSKQFVNYGCLFGIEQEYVILHRDGKPYKWLNMLEPGIGGQGPYYCSVGGDRAFGREIADEHLLACLQAGINICGTNAEVMPSQWEFQIGTCDMLTVSDDLLVARFLLHKITEKYDCCVSFHPKLFAEWNGSGGHTNFSTNLMRRKHQSLLGEKNQFIIERTLIDIEKYSENYKKHYKETGIAPKASQYEITGMNYIMDACEKLAKKHKEHIEVYGADNDKRLTGIHETSNIDSFSWGKQNRNCSVRIPLQVCIDNCGYLEDRRPAANMDPYLVTEIMVRTICSE